MTRWRKHFKTLVWQTQATSQRQNWQGLPLSHLKCILWKLYFEIQSPENIPDLILGPSSSPSPWNLNFPWEINNIIFGIAQPGDAQNVLGLKCMFHEKMAFVLLNTAAFNFLEQVNNKLFPPPACLPSEEPKHALYFQFTPDNNNRLRSISHISTAVLKIIMSCNFPEATSAFPILFCLLTSYGCGEVEEEVEGGGGSLDRRILTCPASSLQLQHSVNDDWARIDHANRRKHAGPDPRR